METFEQKLASLKQAADWMTSYIKTKDAITDVLSQRFLDAVKNSNIEIDVTIRLTNKKDDIYLTGAKFNKNGVVLHKRAEENTYTVSWYKRVLQDNTGVITPAGSGKQISIIDYALNLATEEVNKAYRLDNGNIILQCSVIYILDNNPDGLCYGKDKSYALLDKIFEGYGTRVLRSDFNPEMVQEYIFGKTKEQLETIKKTIEPDQKVIQIDEPCDSTEECKSVLDSFFPGKKWKRLYKLSTQYSSLRCFQNEDKEYLTIGADSEGENSIFIGVNIQEEIKAIRKIAQLYYTHDYGEIYYNPFKQKLWISGGDGGYAFSEKPIKDFEELDCDEQNNKFVEFNTHKETQFIKTVKWEAECNPCDDDAEEYILVGQIKLID